MLHHSGSLIARGPRRGRERGPPHGPRRGDRVGGRDRAAAGWGSRACASESAPSAGASEIVRDERHRRHGGGAARGTEGQGYEPVPDRVADEVGHRGEAELPHDRGAVRVHGLRRDPEPARDGAAREPLDEELRHLSLTIRQRIGTRARRRAARADEGTEDQVGDARREVGLVTRERVDGIEHRAPGSDLTTYARAPAAIASPTKSSSSCMLKAQISVCGRSVRIWRMASRPDSSGSERSSTTTSGRSRRASSTACPRCAPHPRPPTLVPAEQVPEPAPHDVVVLRDHDPEHVRLRHGARPAAAGIRGAPCRRVIPGPRSSQPDRSATNPASGIAAPGSMPAATAPPPSWIDTALALAHRAEAGGPPQVHPR